MATALADTLCYGGRIRGWKCCWVTARRSFKGETFLRKNWVCFLLSADGGRYASYPFLHTFGRQDATVPDVEIGKLHSCWCDV